MIDPVMLSKLYLEDKLSMMQIAKQLECSPNRVVYWMGIHGIKRRSISDAIYQMHNPNGDPFNAVEVRTKQQAELMGMGLGLYWGEGNKKNKYTVRIGNTDPALLRTFMLFLTELYGVNKNDLRFGLQIFTDINPAGAMNYWCRELAVDSSQFYKITVTISGSLGTYRNKSEYGVVTLHYHNKKLRDIIVGLLPR